MKYLLFLLSLFLLVSCDLIGLGSKGETIKVTGTVTYGKGECIPGQKAEDRVGEAFSGSLLFLRKSDIQALNSQMDSFKPDPKMPLTFEEYYDQVFKLLKENSQNTLSQGGEYTIDILPGTYQVITDRNDGVNQSATFSSGAVAVGKDFSFWECERR